MQMADVKEILVQWDSGQSVSAIARTLGYSRPTVRKYIEAGGRVGLTRGQRRRGEAGWERLAQETLQRVSHQREPGTVAKEVAAYHDYLAERVGSVRLSVLHQRLRDEHGLAASWGSFYRYVRAHWPDRLEAEPRLTVRLDDPPPGEEAQVDFFYVGRWLDPELTRTRKLYAFLMTLSHSRHQFLYPVLAEDGTAWLGGHVAAFTFFGGVPRRLVPDNLTAGVSKADRYDPRLNRAYGELARYYGCIIDPSRVAQPTDKPRVERGVGYARESFFRGRVDDFASVPAMRLAAERWARDVAGQRIHGSTGEPPLLAFTTREQPALLPLPPRAWEPVNWTTAVVHADCHLQVAGARYSVPYQHVGRRLEVRLGAHLVEVYDGSTVIATHARREHGRSTVMGHYPEAGQAFLRATPQACLRQAQAIGTATETVVRRLLEVHALHTLRQVQGILRLTERFEATRLEQACARALAAGDGRYHTVRGILERGLEALPPEEPTVARESGAYLRGAAAFEAVQR
jgi:transposase